VSKKKKAHQGIKEESEVFRNRPTRVENVLSLKDLPREAVERGRRGKKLRRESPRKEPESGLRKHSGEIYQEA